MDVVDEFKKFYESIKDEHGNDEIELHPLKEKINFSTPLSVSLPYSDTDLAFRNMASVVILNFSKYSGSVIKKHALDALHKMLNKSIADDDTKVQLILMVHVTKLNVSKPEEVYPNIEGTTCNVDVNQAWIEIACKVLAHSEVNKVIDNLMKDTFGNEYSKRIAARNQQNITVKMIRSDENALRGFTGMNVVYINERYFKTKAFDLSHHSVGTAAEKNKILLIDIATVCIHELSHVKIRQVFDNLDFSTPQVMVNSSTANEREFGRIVENRFFGMIVDWKKSFELKRIPSSYVQDFINALNANTALPSVPVGSDFIQRGGHTMQVSGSGGGADFFFEEFIGIE